MMSEKIAVIGLGYVGLPLALFAAKAYHVIGVDTSPERVSLIRSLSSQLGLEPGLFEYLTEVSGSSFQVQAEVPIADIYVICVPTPLRQIGKRCEVDRSYVEEAVRGVFEECQEGALIILESTIDCRATQKLFESFKAEFKKSVDYAFSPERVMPGNIIEEFANNHRLVGANDAIVRNRAVKFYRDIGVQNIVDTSIEEAELSKLAENTFRDVNIAYANELARICDDLNVDPDRIIELANLHPRVNIHAPGIGVGGHCIPIDPWYLMKSTAVETQLIKAARAVNHSQKEWSINKIEEWIKQLDITYEDSVLVVLGVTYKRNSSDIRESPALAIAKYLKQQWEGGDKFNNVVIVDPCISRKIGELKVIPYIPTIADSKKSVFVKLVDHAEWDRLNYEYLWEI